MKRAMTGGAHRGPVAHARQIRTLRFMQILLVAIGIGLFLLAGLNLNESLGAGPQGRDPLERNAEPSGGKIVSLVVLGGVAIAGAAALQARGGVRLPTPARLEEFAGRAERRALEKAEAIASEPRA